MCDEGRPSSQSSDQVANKTFKKSENKLEVSAANPVYVTPKRIKFGLFKV